MGNALCEFSFFLTLVLSMTLRLLNDLIIQALCPQFIIFRVVVGRSWTQDMAQYATNNNSNSIARTGPIITFSTTPGYEYDLDTMGSSDPSHATSTTLSQMSISPSVDTHSKGRFSGSDQNIVWSDKRGK